MHKALADLRRHDCAELSDNRLTLYAPGFGLGSLHYWDGSWDNDEDQLPRQMQEIFRNQDGLLQVEDESGEEEILSMEVREWFPHMIRTRSAGTKAAVWWENKAIHDDVAVDLISYQGGGLKPGKMRIVHRIRRERGLTVTPLAHGLHLYRENGRLAGIHRFLGFGDSAHVHVRESADHFFLWSDVVLFPEQPREIAYVVAAGEDEKETFQRWQRALNAPEKWAEFAHGRWAFFFDNNVPKFECDDSRWTCLFNHAAYSLRTGLYDFKKGAIKYPYSCPSKWRLCPSWFWDPCFHGFSEKWFRDYPAPISTFCNHIEAQDDLGYLPMTLDSRGNTWKAMGAAERQCQQFLHPITLWDWYLVHGDKRVLRELVPRLAGHATYIWNHRQTGDLPLFVAENGAEVADNSVRLVANPGARAELHQLHTKIQPFDWNAFLYVSERLIARMAGEISHFELQKEFSSRADSRKVALQKLWNPRLNLFSDRRIPGGALSDIPISESLLSLFGDIATPAQRKAEVDFLTDPAHLWTRFPVPSLPLSHPSFTSDDSYRSYWNGRVWPNLNWAYIEGLFRVNERETGRELMFRTLDMMGGDGMPRILENYHPTERKTYPIVHSMFNYSWGAVCLDMIIRRGCGLQVNAAARSVHLDPVGLPSAGSVRLEGVPMRGDLLNVECSRDSSGSWRAHATGATFSKGTPVHWLDM